MRGRSVLFASAASFGWPLLALLVVGFARWRPDLGLPIRCLPEIGAVLFDSDLRRLLWPSGAKPLAGIGFFALQGLFGAQAGPFSATRLLLSCSIALLVGRIGRRRLGGWAWVAALLCLLWWGRPASNQAAAALGEPLSMLLSLSALAMYQKGSRGAAAALFGLALLSGGAGTLVPFLLAASDVFVDGVPRDSASRRKWALTLLGFGAAAAACSAWSHWTFVPNSAATPAPWTFRLAGSFMLGSWFGAATLGALLSASLRKADPAERDWYYFCAACLLLGSLGADQAGGGIACAGAAWLAAAALRQLAGLGTVPFALSCVLAIALPLRAATASPRIVPEFDALDCPAEGDRPGGKDCVESLHRLFLTRARLPSDDGEVWGKLRRNAEQRLGPEKTAELETYYTAALRDPCRMGLLRRRLEAPDESSLLRGVSADQAFLSGRDELQARGPEAAIPLLESAIVDDPGLPEAHRLLAFARDEGGRTGALESLKRSEWLAANVGAAIPGCDPRDGGASQEARIRLGWDRTYGRGLRLFKEGDLASALRALDDANRLEPDSPEARLSRGVLRTLRGSPRKAISDFAAALGDIGREKAWRLSASAAPVSPGRDDLDSLAAAVLSSRAEAFIKLGFRLRAIRDLRAAGSGPDPELQKGGRERLLELEASPRL